MLIPPSRFADAPWRFSRTEALSVPPFIWSKIPIENEDNVHRRILANIVAARKPPPPPGFETDDEILISPDVTGSAISIFFVTTRKRLSTHRDEMHIRGRISGWLR